MRAGLGAAVVLLGVACAALSQLPPGQATPVATPVAIPVTMLAHFHHLHLNSTDPDAAIEYYATRLNSEKAKFGAGVNALWTQKSWILFNKVKAAPPSEVLSAIYHMGWGAEDMPAEYKRQLELGTKFETPLTDAAGLFGRGTPGKSFFAYLDGPDHALIEINTTTNHVFQHIHLLSDDPVATAAWYRKEFGGISRPGAAASLEPRVVNGLQVFPMTSIAVDNVNFIWFPKDFASKGVYAAQWKGRTTFASPRGRVIDHFAFSVDNLDRTLARLQGDGVRIISKPRRQPGVGIKSAFVEGPDKIEIELLEGAAVKPAGN